MAEVIQDVKMRNFVESSVSDDFGLTVDEIAAQCGAYGRFNAWLNGDTARIKEVLNAVKDNGVSPAFFASYERTEGYNAQWGWLNHTSVNGSPVNDAISVANWVDQQSRNTSDNPAWIDLANYNDFVPESVKQEGNAHFASLPSGTIGKVVIAGTAAATWEVYYPNGLKAEYNGVRDYGTPINHMIQYIEEWGGTVTGGSSGGGDGSGRQLAVLPIDVVNISQGEYGTLSHYEGTNQELAIDFLGWGPDGRVNTYPIQAPFDSEVIDVLPEFAQVNWRSTVPVKGADGNDYETLVYTIVHDWDYDRWSVGDTIQKGGHIANTGSAGQSTGDHLHLQVIEAETHLWPTPISAQRHIYDIFDTKHVTMWVNDEGYEWKELDYEDGTGGGDNGGGNTPVQDDIIPLLLSGALAGW